MSHLFTRLKANNLKASHLASDSTRWTAVLCVALILLFSGCSRSGPANGADDGVLAKERARIEAEKRAEREVTIRELLARDTPAETDSEKMWASFRQAYPYHNQALALSAPSADKSRTLIISEPPPHVATGDVLLPLAGLLRNHSEQTQKVGYDGWTKDLVVEIAGSEPEVASALSSLNRLLFYTSYKSYILPLPAKAPSSADFDLDLRVTSAELKSWVIDARDTFSPIEGGDSLSLQQLFDQKVSGVFYRGGGGIVGWWLPKGRTVDDSRVQARQFSLDSDLIVGALSNPKGILVLGRDRVVPEDMLPPLRVETLSLLAAVQQGQQGELKQSYERMHLLAGNIDGQQDWAPILLSPELRDTEYGSLLNITDQILKGWSNNGDTGYVNFEKYPRPNNWPFKAKPLLDRLDTDELTYNWNTKGAGYTVDAGEYRLFALNRTGALPVSYIPEGREGQVSPDVSAVEEEAYNYFARLKDPNLARVVQYAAMYQIFSAFDVSKPSTPPSATSLPDQKLEEMTDGLMAEIRNASPQKLDELARQLAPLVSAQFGRKEIVQAYVAEAMKFLRGELEQRLQEEGYVKGTSEYNFMLSQMSSRVRGKVQGLVKADLAKRRREMAGQVNTQLKLVAAGTEPDDKGRIVRVLTLSALAGLRNLPRDYAKAADAQSSGWIHTPAVVISWNSGSLAGMVGGHNLDAKVTQFRISDDVVAGTTKIDAEGKILVNSRDINKVNEVVRTAGRAEGQLPSELSAELNSALRRVSDAPPRSLEVALELPSGPPLPPNRPPSALVSPDFPGPGFGGEYWRAGWARPRSQLPESDALAALLRQRRADIPDLILVDRDPTGLIRILNSEKSPAVQAVTTEDAVDMVVGLMRKAPDEAQSLKLEFRGFARHEVDGFNESLSVRAADERIPREISSVIDEGGSGGAGGPPIKNELPGGDGGAGKGGGGGNKGGGGSNKGGGGNEGGDGFDPGGPGRRGDDGLLLRVGQRKYDFSRAEVTVHPEITTLKNGVQSSRITVDVPAADAGAAGRSTIELGFRPSTPREVVTAATHRVGNSVRELIRGIRNEYQAIRFNLKLNGEIKRVSKEMDIDIKLIRHSFEEGKGDLYFSKKEDKDEPPAPVTAACETA